MTRLARRAQSLDCATPDFDGREAAQFAALIAPYRLRTGQTTSGRKPRFLPLSLTKIQVPLPGRAAGAVGRTATCATTRTDGARSAGGAAARVGSTATACAARLAAGL